MRTVQRTIIRPDQELDVRPLYIGGMSSVTSGQATARQSGASERWDESTSQRGGDTAQSSEGTTGEATESASGSVTVSSEGHARVQPHQRVTFGTYFNSFPASYWRRWTEVDEVVLRVRVSGDGLLLVYRSTVKGHVHRVESVAISDDEPITREFTLTLKPFIDGGWYWFDVEAGEGEVVVESAEWLVDTDRTTPGRVTIGITTFNRQQFCTDQLIVLSQTPDVLELVDKIIVVDQGTQKIVDHEQYAVAKKALGDRLQVIEQGNLGGSGGFSRAMMETVDAGQSDYCLLLDDDVVCEPDGVLRAVAFADLAKTPTTVGGMMFSLYEPTVMHAFGETVAKYRWFWGPAPQTIHGLDLARYSLQSTSWLHRRIDGDYNGWWMCLIPVEIIRDVGFSLPMFIKWDDAEYGLRTRAAGYPTVTMPGVAVWHVPWTDKDDIVDWQAYFHARNRIISALLHSPYDHGGRLIWESYEAQVRHAMAMQYGPCELRLLAIEDVLEGPGRMHRDVLERLPEIRELRKQYVDSQPLSELDQFPEPRREKPPRKGKGPATPRGAVGKMKTLTAGLLRQVRPVKEMATQYPESSIPSLDVRWWLLAQHDSALVSSADGMTAAWYRRDPAKFRDIMRRSAMVHMRLYKEWPHLVEQYREALPELASPDTWRKTFDNSIAER